MTEEQLRQIDEALRGGSTPGEVADQLGFSRQALQYQLLTSGKRIVTYRRLEDTAPADAAKATTAVEQD